MKKKLIHYSIPRGIRILKFPTKLSTFIQLLMIPALCPVQAYSSSHGFEGEYLAGTTDKFERPSGLLARAIVVTGTVRDQKGESLPGVSIKIKGAPGGTSSDISGRFSISVPDANSTLIFTYVGYSDLEVPVGGRTSLNVVLEESSTALTEVVVIGYGTLSATILKPMVSCRLKRTYCYQFLKTNSIPDLTGIRTSDIKIKRSGGCHSFLF